MSYKAFDGEDLAFLKSVCGDERVTARDAIGEDFCHDELGGAFARPDVRVQVASIEEISKARPSTSFQNRMSPLRSQSS